MCSGERAYARNKTRCRRDVTFRDINLQFRSLTCVSHLRATRYTLRVYREAREESSERSDSRNDSSSVTGADEIPRELNHRCRFFQERLIRR